MGIYIVLYFFLVVSILLLVACFITWVNGDYTSNDAKATLLSILIIGICILGLNEVSNEDEKPHGGMEPTIEDVAKGEAHIDTLVATCKGKREYQFYINWNDSIIPKK